MPTTYTNGLKLPDLGSIDWYNAYKNNIDILDPIVGTVNGVATTYAPISHNHDASEITSGTIDIARLPPAALERLTTVADQTARYALTTSTVQLGDTVKQLDTGIMYLVVDTTKLNSADGYVEYSAGTASKAIADEDGTSIKTGYGKLAGNQTWSGVNYFNNENLYQTASNPRYAFKSSMLEIGVQPSGHCTATVDWLDSNDVELGYSRFVEYNNSIQTYEVLLKNKAENDSLSPAGNDISASLQLALFKNGSSQLNLGTDTVAPTSNSASLGSSSYQWSSVYAQSYYYNGTAWGLDKANEWTGSNKFKSANSNFGLQSTTAEAGSTTATSNWIYWQDKNGFQDAYISRDFWSDGGDTLRISISGKRSNGAPSTSGASVECGIRLDISTNGSKSVSPFVSGDTDLGTSTNKWKTLNGVNPGALSLPDYNSTAKVNISGSIVPDQYGNIVYTPPINGWLYVCFNVSNATTSDSIFYIQAKDNNVANSSFVQTSWMPASSGTSSLAIFFPVVANKQFVMQINFSNYTIVKAHVIPCLGNV